MKPIVYLNRFVNKNSRFCKLVVKHSNENLKQRLSQCTYLQKDNQWGYYFMNLSDHNIQMLTDQLEGIANVDKRYLYRQGARFITSRIHKGKNVVSRKVKHKPALTIHSIEHKGKMFGLIMFKYHPGIYKRLLDLPYVKYSQTYKRFVTHLDTRHLDRLLYDLAPMFQVNLDAKVEIEDMTLLKKFWEQSYLKGQYISCPDAYLESLKLKNYSINTIRTYHNMLLRYFNHFPVDLSIINSYGAEEINEYHRQMIQCKKYSFSTINQSINAIKYYYKEILQKPLSLEQLNVPKKEKPLPKVLTPDQLSAVISQIDNIKHKSMVLLAYSSGIRIGELLNLKVEDLDFDRRMLHIRGAKGRKDRYSILSNTVIEMLKQYIKAYGPKAYLYEGQHGGRYSNSSVQKLWKRALRAAGISETYNFHCLRHSFATHVLENGTDIRFIQQLLGHRSSRTTEIYTHVSNRYITNIKSPGDEVKL